MPLRIVAFCANRIKHLEENPQLVDSYTMIPWFKFKDIMFDVYDHRILHAPELNGAVNTSYCSLNEHLLVYFMDLCRKRAKAEEMVVDVLINLRYYMDNWQRAKQFVANLELTYLDANANTNKRLEKEHDLRGSDDNDEFGDPKLWSQPHAYLKDNQVSENDLYAQEFYLYCYSLLCADRGDFLESKEGFTYVRLKQHDKVAAKCLRLFKGPSSDAQKWTLRVRRLVKRLKNRANQEIDYLDLDMILGMMMADYKEGRLQT